MIKISNPEKFRENVKRKFSVMLKDESSGDNLERGIYNNTLKTAEEKHIVKKWENTYFALLYINKFRTIYQNLLCEEVFDLIVNKKIKPHELAFMTHQEIQPNKWDPLIEDLKIKNQNKYTPKIEASTDNFECNKCKPIEISLASKEGRSTDRDQYTQCSYYQLQTRSADEPMTTFVTCIKCGTRWRC
jgi:transcription elongation factor S-II